MVEGQEQHYLNNTNVNALENKNFEYEKEYYEYDTGDNNDFGVYILFLDDEGFKNLKEKIIAYLKIDKDDFNIRRNCTYCTK